MYFPEDIWRIIKSYTFFRDFCVGDFIYGIPRKDFLGQPHYNNFISERGGIVVSKTGRFKNATYYISVADFGGNYLVLTNNGLTLHKKNMKPLDKLILMNEFPNWWHVMHKSLFQETLVQTII